MRISRFVGIAAIAALVSSCGGGGSSSNNNTGSGGSNGTPSSGGSATCSLSSRASWTLAQLDEWYLFPDLLDKSVDAASFSTLDDYIDALVAPARAANRDRYFTYVTSIAEENAYYASGANAGFGFRLGYDTANDRVFVIETYEGTPALGNNIDRGSELRAIGPDESSMESVRIIMSAGGPQAVINALGPNTAGVTRAIRLIDASGVDRTVTITKAEYDLDPVSDRYGAKIIDDGGKLVGYINLRSFIAPANADLSQAFADFRAAGVTELIIDQRYNGGGAIAVAEHFGDLMARNLDGEVFDRIAFRASKASNNSTYTLNARPESIAPTRIAFITRAGTASASEMVINGMLPHITDIALIGEDTYGKPVGQIAEDLTACDDRLRIVALKVENADGQGDYYDGLLDFVPNSCSANDDISAQLGDPNEAMVARALDWLAGRSCTAIGAVGKAELGEERQLLQPDRPSAAQVYAPGSF